MPSEAAQRASSPTSMPYARRVFSAMPRAWRERSKPVSASRQAAGRASSPASLRSSAVAGFFINVDDGRVATQTQLIEAGQASDRLPPELPWHPLQGPNDVSTAHYAVLRKK